MLSFFLVSRGFARQFFSSHLLALRTAYATRGDYIDVLRCMHFCPSIAIVKRGIIHDVDGRFYADQMSEKRGTKKTVT